MNKWIKSVVAVFFIGAIFCTSIYAENKAKISETKVNPDDQTLEIYGKKFTADLKVVLSGTELEVLESSDTYIKAGLGEIKDGPYKLVLATEEQLADDKMDPFMEIFIGEPDVKKPKDSGEEASTPDDGKEKKDKEVKKPK